MVVMGLNLYLIDVATLLSKWILLADLTLAEGLTNLFLLNLVKRDSMVTSPDKQD